MASSIVFTANGTDTLIEWNDGQAQTLSAHRALYTYTRTGDTFKIITTGNANVIGEFVNADLTTPYADADALEVALQSFFSGAVSGGVVVTMTIAELQTATAAGTLGDYVGGLVKVSDLADRGAFLLVTSATTVSEDGEGIFLNAVWANGTEGDDSDVETLTTIAPATYLGQWALALEATIVDGDIVAWLDTTAPQLGYRNYQLVDVGNLDGSGPSANTTAYTVLPRGPENYGYVVVSCPIKFDLANGVIIQREQAGTIYRYDYMYQAILTYNAIDSYPWGKSNWALNTIDNARIGYENTEGSVFKISASVGGSVGPANYLGIGSSLAFSTFSSNSIFDAVIQDGVAVQYVTVADGVQFSAKTITASMSGMRITDLDTATESLASPTWDAIGRQIRNTFIEDAELLSGIGAGIEIAPGTTNIYKTINVRLAYSQDFDPYVGAGLIITISGVTVATPPATLCTVNTATVMVALNMNQLGITASDPIIIKTSNSADYTGGTTTNNSLTVDVVYTV